MANVNGSIIFQGASGRYNFNLFITDTAATVVNFSQDGAASATTPNFWISPDNIQLIDIAIPAGLATAKGLRAFSDDAPTGQNIVLANHLNTLPARPVPGFGWQKGRKISFYTY